MEFDFAGVTDFGHSYFERRRWNLVSTELDWNNVTADTFWSVGY
jgi:hypothetical protein